MSPQSPQVRTSQGVYVLPTQVNRRKKREIGQIEQLSTLHRDEDDAVDINTVHSIGCTRIDKMSSKKDITYKGLKSLAEKVLGELHEGRALTAEVTFQERNLAKIKYVEKCVTSLRQQCNVHVASRYCGRLAPNIPVRDTGGPDQAPDGSPEVSSLQKGLS